MDEIKKLRQQLKRVKQFIAQDVPQIAGIEAVNHFNENFVQQGFDGAKWKEVKRRKSNSVWYGFKRGAKAKKPANHPSRKNVKSKYKKRKKSPITNWSKTATQTPILSSQKSNLENSLKYKIVGKKVYVFSNLPYAKVHNEGGRIKIFGRKTVKITARPFIGESKQLNAIIKKEIEQGLKQILK